MAKKKTVPIEHKELGLTSAVYEESLSAWLRGGWTRVDDGDSDEGQEQLPVFTTQVAKNDDPADPDADKE